MKVSPMVLADVLLVEPKVFEDSRGFFCESFNAKKFREATGLSVDFVQDNHSHSIQNVLRGLHYQITQPQGKLIRVATGAIYEVVVDMRKSSPDFGRWISVHLSAENQQQLWVPPGFANGFIVLSTQADVLYKTTDYWAPEHERCIHWSDPDLAIDWQIGDCVPIVSAKDQMGKSFKEADFFA